MKFTKEEVLEDIKKAFTGANGNSSLKLSDRTVTETIEALIAFAGEETERVDMVAKVKPVIDTANRNLIKEQSDFIKDYKPVAPPATTPTTTPATAPPTPPVTDITAFMKQLVDAQKTVLDQALSPLRQELDSIKAEKARNSLFSEVKAKFEEKKPDPKRKGFADEAWNIVSASIKEGTTADDLFKAYDAQYNKLCSLVGANGYIPIDATGNPVETKSAFQETVDAVKKSQDGKGDSQAIKERLGIIPKAPETK